MTVYNWQNEGGDYRLIVGLTKKLFCQRAQSKCCLIFVAAFNMWLCFMYKTSAEGGEYRLIVEGENGRSLPYFEIFVLWTDRREGGEYRLIVGLKKLFCARGLIWSAFFIFVTALKLGSGEKKGKVSACVSGKHVHLRERERKRCGYRLAETAEKEAELNLLRNPIVCDCDLGKICVLEREGDPINYGPKNKVFFCLRALSKCLIYFCYYCAFYMLWIIDRFIFY